MRKRILWISQLIIAVVLLLYSVFSTQIFYENNVERGVESLRLAASVYDEDKYPPTGEGAVLFGNALGGYRVTFIALDGQVLGDSAEAEGNRSDREEVKEALERGEGVAVRSSRTVGENSLYYCKKIQTENGEFLLRVSSVVPSVLDTFSDVLPTLVWFLLLDFLLCFLFTFLETEYIFSPVKRIVKDASLNIKTNSKYPELQPLVALLNKRNEEVSQKIKALADEKERVEKAQRSKNDFIANVTHEMNTPLTSVKGYSELIASGSLTPEQSSQAAKILLEQSDRLSNLIARIINYNALDNDDLPSYEVNAAQIANGILDGLSPELEKKKISLIREIADGIILQSRRERVEEVFTNLIANAVRYNVEGGTLIVRLENTEKGVRFTVSDTGVGIAEEDIERIFDRFYTVDKSHGGKDGGFGLGLAVVKKICRNSGWTIRVESSLGKGATFIVDM